MKTRTFGMIILAALLAACAAPPAPTPAPTSPPPTSTPQPSPTPEPSPTPDPVLFRDDFDSGELGFEWHIVNENPDRYSLAGSPGWLEISAGRGEARSGDIENLVVHQVPEGDFELETLLRFQPGANFQFAGLLIFESGADYLQFGRAFCNAAPPRCVGDGLYLDAIVDGNFAGDNFAAPSPAGDSVYLRLRKEGTNYTTYFSSDGSQWLLHGTQTSEMLPLFIGLLAGQSRSGSRPAQFDYFQITALN